MTWAAAARRISKTSGNSVSLFGFGPADFVLPADLESLGDSAFEGDALITAVDARHCSSIGRDAFKGTGLKQILLPKDCTIDSDAFAGCEKVYCPASFSF
ncbi:MAG: leucine-rich repeat domain-containing protein [Oscillospiraceae bacterium]|nr:leucine-rich repeat domain-containing protein [Oscillospiraceae bacterium]